ncbi:MAG: DNA polymerase III subunit delta [Candidatus Adiutrix sp.]|jgi:DNA polymerase-3 subunit delta|nr:DNA polymerase III subunit delta [Candidatus Adiutrix sp.]
MTPAAFIREIKGADRRPLYLLSGGEPTAVRRCLTAAGEAVDPGFRDFNLQIMNPAAGEAARLTGEAATMAFFAPPRMVVAKNPPFSADDWNILAAYLDDPNPSSTIVLALDKIDARLKFFKKIKAAGLEVDCSPPKGAALVKWLAAEFQSRGVTAETQVCAQIIERAGSDLYVLASEAEKLSLYLGQGGALTAGLVQRLVSLAPNANIFALGEALGRHDLSSALSTLLDLLATEHPMPVLAMMIRHFRLILIIKTRQASLGVSRLGREEAASLDINPFVLDKTQGQAASWPWREVAAALTALEAAHLTLVTTSTPAAMVLENLALELGRLGRAA